ncbi:tRNA (guanine(46)-N(7))-methyltransferase [hydrothermal vent metagenome]|uniref:tRNA (guanine(46)-N(7))-methyltransferase n=1 Tax=hydrothermal vent metagenome TaxID=652676 RepID=A0A3B0WQW9_9ZZZZ
MLRQGRLTKAQQNALNNHWQNYGINFSEQLLDYSALFNNDNETIIEIGFGDGASLLQQAINQPQYNFIGIEVHGPGVGHLIHSTQSQNIRNIKVIRHDAVEVLTQQIANNSIKQLQLFFPDPWHKKRHHKRRILKPAFIELVQQKLKTGGHFHMATDWQHYAEHMLAEMDDAATFCNVSATGNYSETQGARCETKFERRGIKLGHGVWDLIYEKR